MSDIDLLLYRPIKNGKQYDKLIPKTTCKPTVLGKGMTDFSVSEMAKIVKKYFLQLSKIAPLLRNGSLQQTCNAIHKWTYDHFQYKADKETQFLRSPSCSWHVRYEGIDCKSYSILASSILVNLGIAHYIRRIKQPGFYPELWTHVYVIVPKDQKTGKLSSGYYTIDGTVATQDESIYTDKSDLFMGMQHIGLNGARRSGYSNPGLGLSIAEVKGWFAGGWKPSCIGGSLDAQDFNEATAIIVPAFDDMFYNVNQALRYGDGLIEKINKLIRVAHQLKDHSSRKASGNWKSACSRDSVNGYKDLCAYYYNIVNGPFMEWLKYYYNVTTGSQTIPNNTFEYTFAYDKNSDVANIQVPTVTALSPKATTLRFQKIAE